MLSYLLAAAFIGLTSAAGTCKYFVNQNTGFAHGTQYCNILPVGSGVFVSVWYDCLNTTHMAETTFATTDCTGPNVTVLYSPDSGMQYSCKSTLSVCAKRFMINTPCVCDISTNCTFVADFGISSGQCVKQSATTSEMVEIKCITGAPIAKIYDYSNSSDCSGTPDTTKTVPQVTCTRADNVDDTLFDNTTTARVSLCSASDFTTMPATTMSSAAGMIVKTLLALIVATPLLF
jgi:hypothetical protein